MPDDDMTTRWTVSVSRDTDIAVRTFMAEHGMEDNLSKFIEDAVRWRVFDRTITEARAGFADLSPDALEALAGEALTTVRQASSLSSPKPEDGCG